ncbi:hypothetical protein [Hymenobacter lucidus]|uniref:HTH cro/C1-type domain-containing protein n=1 Tax=Hymenobacter lucidus TaxID=2880930 RepID=A0ABS8AWX4_9BACT|nr:hypothetical protein [Hymenobacter lucidus]MCB2410292.1 hypothetical protein [Hymenobacter lucidus]
MSDYTNEGALRQLLGLTQQVLAIYLRVSRELLAQVELGRRSLPLAALERLTPLLTRLHGAGGLASIEPPLAPSETNPQHSAAEQQEIRQRLRTCRHKAGNSRYQLENMRRQARPFHRRLALLAPLLAALPPPTGPDPDEQDRRWYTHRLEDANWRLSSCGTLAQGRLEATILALDTEIAALEKLLPAALE